MSAMGLGDDDPLFDLKIPWYRVAPEDKGFGRKREGERELMRERQVVLSVRLGDSVRGVHTRLVQRCEVAAERLTLVDAAGTKLGHSEDWDGGTLGQHGVVRPLSKEEKEEQEWEDLDEEDEPAIELEELDDVLDERLREKKTSEEMAQMAIDAVNKKWWDRAADGNLVKVQQFMAEEPRQDLVLINWRNPLNYDRTAVMVASLRGQRKTLEWLVNTHKPRINAYDTNGWADGFEWWTQWTPLNSNPSVPSVRVLGDRGAWPEPDPIHTQNSCLGPTHYLVLRNSFVLTPHTSTPAAAPR